MHEIVDNCEQYKHVHAIYIYSQESLIFILQNNIVFYVFDSSYTELRMQKSIHYHQAIRLDGSLAKKPT